MKNIGNHSSLFRCRYILIAKMSGVLLFTVVIHLIIYVVSRALNNSVSFTFLAGSFELTKIVSPEFIMVFAEMVQPFPGVNAGVVVIIKVQADSISANWFDICNIDIFLAELQDFFTRAMSTGS